MGWEDWSFETEESYAEKEKPFNDWLDKIGVEMKEKDIEKKVCDYAKEHGWIVYKLGGPNQKGQPDRMFLQKSIVFFIEFKAPGGKVSALQDFHLTRLIENYFIAMVIDDVETGKGLIDACTKRLARIPKGDSVPHSEKEGDAGDSPDGAREDSSDS